MTERELTPAQQTLQPLDLKQLTGATATRPRLELLPQIIGQLPYPENSGQPSGQLEADSEL